MKRNSMLKKINISLLVMALGINLFGCGATQSDDKSQETEQTSEEEIELIDPVGVANEYAYAGYRNIYKAEVVQCVVSPGITEYQYTTSDPFWKYGALPGDEVSAGDVLIYAATESVENEIESLSDQMRLSEEDHIEEITSLYENRYDAYKEEYRTSCDYMEVKNNEPKEDESWYSGWASGVMPLESAYKNAKLRREQIDTSIQESEELYALEKEYNSQCLAKLESKRDSALIESGTDGVVVGLNYYSAGDFITKNSEVVAVGNMEQKVIYAPYLSAKAYSQMAELYAVSNGKKYEIEYEPVDQNEYKRLKSKNTDVYVPYIVQDASNELQMGDSIALVMVKEKAENVLCVPADAVVNESGQNFVYLYSESGSTSTPVKIGLVGNMYTEILEGVKDGDRVLSKSAVGMTSKTKILEKGSTSQELKENGMLIYPSTEWIENPSKYGDAYVSEILVSKNESVEEGQEIIRIEVVPDSTAIARLERKIQRQKERLATLQLKKSQNYSTEVDYSLEQAIRQKNTAISRYTDELNKLREYSGIVTLKAKQNGVILSLSELKPGDHLSYKQKLVCLADTTDSILAVDNSGGKLSFGKEVTVSFKDFNAATTEVTGKVVNVSDNALSSSLQSKSSLIRFEGDAALKIAEIGGIFESDTGWGRALFNVTTKIGEFDNCVLVPRSAVVLKNGDTFVKVKQGEDRVELVQFIAGGYDMTNYWVISGLSEGMEICLD